MMKLGGKIAADGTGAENGDLHQVSPSKNALPPAWCAAQEMANAKNAGVDVNPSAAHHFSKNSITHASRIL
jgi:hypothetical protein